MADKYIRKQDAIYALDKEYRYGADIDRCGLAKAFKAIESLEPADVAPVVRCKDCLFFTTEKSCCRPEGLIKAREDAFCSYGERREE